MEGASARLPLTRAHGAIPQNRRLQKNRRAMQAVSQKKDRFFLPQNETEDFLPQKWNPLRFLSMFPKNLLPIRRRQKKQARTPKDVLRPTAVTVRDPSDDLPREFAPPFRAKKKGWALFFANENHRREHPTRWEHSSRRAPAPSCPGHRQYHAQMESSRSNKWHRSFRSNYTICIIIFNNFDMI